MNKLFTDFLNKIKIEKYTRNISLGAVFAEKFNRTIRDLLKRDVFEKKVAIWIDCLPVITKKNNNRNYSSTKITPLLACLKQNEGYVYQNLLDEKKKRIKPKFEIHDFVKTADLKRTVAHRDTNNWVYNLKTFTEVYNDTIPSYRIRKFFSLHKYFT